MFTSKNWHRVAALTAFVCAFALAGCKKKEEPSKTEGDPKPAQPGQTPPGPTPSGPTPPTAVDLSKTTPVATYPANVYRDEMVKDSNFPASKHAGKVIEVTGVLQDFGSGPNTGLLLAVGPNKLLDTMTFKVSDKHPWGKVLPTQSVTLRMLTPKSANDPYVWQIIEAKGPPPTTFTAEGFVKERNANVKGFDEKYANTQIVVTGTVAGVQDNGGGGMELQLAAGKDGNLRCIFPPAGLSSGPLTASQMSALKPGVKAKLLGGVVGDRLAFCILIEPAP